MPQRLEEVLELIRETESTLRYERLRKNRRHHVRVAVQTQLSYHLREWKGKNLSHVRGEARGVTIDMSLGGIAFVTNLDLPAGLVLVATLIEEPWSSLGPIELVVVRATDASDGVRIAAKIRNMPEDGRMRLHGLLLNRLKSE